MESSCKCEYLLQTPKRKDCLINIKSVVDRDVLHPKSSCFYEIKKGDVCQRFIERPQHEPQLADNYCMINS